MDIKQKQADLEENLMGHCFLDFIEGLVKKSNACPNKIYHPTEGTCPNCGVAFKDWNKEDRPWTPCK